jgi:predicted esterase
MTGEVPGPRTVLAAAVLAIGGAACGTVVSDSRLADVPVPRAVVPSPDRPAAAPQEPEPAPTASATAPPRPPFDSLDVRGFPPAVVALPAERALRRPVVVVVHGLGDWPERHCEAWRNLTAARAFVLCPRGDHAPERSRPGDRRYTHPAGPPLRRHIDAALGALAERYGGEVDAVHPTVAGFSLGATEVALLAQSDPARFPRVAILEGGLDVWIASTIRAFAAGGGERVLFGCGSSWCTPLAQAAASRIEQSGVGVLVVSTDVGHTMGPALQDALAGSLPWLLGDEPLAQSPLQSGSEGD